MKQGRKDNQIEIASNMISKGIDRKLILELTGLSEEELKLLTN